MRFFNKLAASAESVEFNYKVNETISKLRNLQPKDAAKTLNPKTKFLTGDTLSMADLLGWDFALKHKLDSKWAKSIGEIAQARNAKDAVDKIVDSIPKIDYFKFHVIKKIADATNATSEDIVKASLVPKAKEQGDFAIPVAALRLPGNPAELAKKIATEVNIFLHR